MSGMRFTTRPAPPELQGLVRELWLLEDDGRFSAGLPKPYVELVVSLAGVHWWRAAPGAAEHRFVESWVTPIQSRARYARAAGRRRLIGARLEPWAAVALFGLLPAGEGAPPPTLTSLIGAEARRLRERLLAAPDEEACFAAFATWLSGRAAAIRGRRKAGGSSAHASAAALARSLEISPRSLRRRFSVEAGLAPKRWLKLHRLDAVLRDRRLGEREAGLAAIAQDHGYADQSHLSREVAALTGTTPGALRRRPEGGPPHYVPIG